MGALEPVFDRLRRELVNGLRAVETNFSDRLGATETALGQRFDVVETKLAQLTQQVEASAVETRRHFDVVAESLRSAIALIAEGVVALSERTEEFRAEVRQNFAGVDRRLLRLDARVSTLERR